MLTGNCKQARASFASLAMTRAQLNADVVPAAPDEPPLGFEIAFVKMPASGGDAIQVMWDGGFAPVASPDGKFLYYTKALEATSLWKMPAEGGPGAKIVDGLSTYLNLAIADSGVICTIKQTRELTPSRFIFGVADDTLDKSLERCRVAYYVNGRVRCVRSDRFYEKGTALAAIPQ